MVSMQETNTAPYSFTNRTERASPPTCRERIYAPGGRGLMLILPVVVMVATLLIRCVRI
jgi:hypothetical protein